MAVQTDKSVKSDEQIARERELASKQKWADEENKKRSGVGTRIQVGQTRGKNPMVISYEQFDESQPATHPTSIQQFTEISGATEEKDLLPYLIAGLNELNYTAASDPLREFVNPEWKDEVQNQFRIVVRNYSRGAQVSLDEAVALIKPGFDKQFSTPPSA